MKYFRITLSALVFCFLISVSQGQRIEVGGFLGVSNYQGDLSPITFTPSEFHFAKGLVARMNIAKILSIRANMIEGTISGSDVNDFTGAMSYRNLSFRSSIKEISVITEWSLLRLKLLRNSRIVPVFLGGAGLFHFNPKALYNGKWENLQPLGTEGQGLALFPERKKYKLIQLSFPMGLGLKYMTRKWAFMGELGFRKTQTDYLDDVSTTYVDREILLASSGNKTADLSNRMGELTGSIVNADQNKERGNAQMKDWYFFLGVVATYRLKNKNKINWNGMRPHECFDFEQPFE